MKHTPEFSAFLKTLNPWWQDPNHRFQVVERPFYLSSLIDSSHRLTHILIGARRVGKTYLLYSLINRLLAKKIDPTTIIYLNGDLREIQALGIRHTLEHLSKSNHLDFGARPHHIIVDEVQELIHWQSEIKLYQDTTQCQFYLSGSSATLLTQKTSKLTGRFQTLRVLPLSFPEYLEFNHYSPTPKDKIKILEKYLKDGGYPEKIGHQLPGYLTEVVDSTLYRDLLEKFKIKTPSALENIIKLLADKITTPVSAYRISQDLKIDNETAANYLHYLESVYLIYPLRTKAKSHGISLSTPPKYYFNDTGILNEIGITPRIGHLAENAVFVELLRRQNLNSNYKLYSEVIEGQEFDFSANNQLYEVKYQTDITTDYDLSRYELTGRSKQASSNPIIIGTIAIHDYLRHSGLSLDYISLFDFLMGKTRY